ncbi:MAG: hypothetical protein HY088_09875, partial [Ignavibacteriales bacterium]|nr:hypothetical protein [Ignavibacteriales bacterium]
MIEMDMLDKIKKLTNFPMMLSFIIEGTHTDLTGAGNQEWHKKVANRVSEACKEANVSATPDGNNWYAVYALWFAVNTNGKRDLDNLHLKP